MRDMIAAFHPDVAHVRNIYHHLSPSILWELKKQHVPVIYHINDFKLLCPSYNMVSHGQACEPAHAAIAGALSRRAVMPARGPKRPFSPQKLPCIAGCTPTSAA